MDSNSHDLFFFPHSFGASSVSGNARLLIFFSTRVVGASTELLGSCGAGKSRFNYRFLFGLCRRFGHRFSLWRTWLAVLDARAFFCRNLFPSSSVTDLAAGDYFCICDVDWFDSSVFVFVVDIRIIGERDGVFKGICERADVALGVFVVTND